MDGLQSAFGADDPVILGMRPNPNPNDMLAGLPAKRAIMIPHPHTEPIHTALQSTEMKRGVLRVAAPQAIILNRQLLNWCRECVEQFPEPPGGDRFHF